ncbi:MAG TPA: hypothetical protein VLZ54_09495 [Arenibacter sp.]|nr:hypothetical protein [Arenibacter sp.]
MEYSLAFGPTLAVGKLFLNKKLRTNISTSYNTSHTKMGRQNSIYNFRLGSNYALMKKHNLSLNFLVLFRKTLLNIGRNLTLTLGYRYSFDNFKLNFKGGRDPKDYSSMQNTLSFRYRNVSYSGTIIELNQQLSHVFQSVRFADVPLFKKEELKILFSSVRNQKKSVEYKENALIFLKALYDYHDFKDLYNTSLFNVISAIRSDMRQIDFKLEKLFIETKVALNEHPLTKNPKENQIPIIQQKEYSKLMANHAERSNKLFGHRWMEKEFARYGSMEIVKNPFGHLKEFKDQIATRAYRLYEKNNNLRELEEFLEFKIIDYYYKKSIGHINPDAFELRYINKN